jgi:hypothetical protein
MENLTKIKVSNLHYLKIEADTIETAFSIFRNKLEEKDVFINEYQNIDDLLIQDNYVISEVAKKFIASTKNIEECIVWGGKFTDAKDNMLSKKFAINNITQSGTKKWETRYVIKGIESNKRHDDTCTTKGAAIAEAKELAIKVKENLSIDVEKVLISHHPSVAEITYIKDPSEHDNIFIFMCNTVTFDEEEEDILYEENVELDPNTKQYKIRVETIFEYDKKIIL